MWPVMHDLALCGLSGLRADALFASGLQRDDEPGAAQVRRAVAAAIRAFGRSGCAGRVAQEFGDHPETAVIRMRWARAVAGAVFADSGCESGPRPAAHTMPSRGSLLRGDGQPGRLLTAGGGRH